MSTKRHLASMSAFALLLAAVFSGCKAPSTYVSRQYFRNRYIPGKPELKNSDYPVPCYTPEFYGYNGTCWRTWPENWVPCPEELVEERVVTEVDKPTGDVPAPNTPPEVDPTQGRSTQPMPPQTGPRVNNPIPGQPPRPGTDGAGTAPPNNGTPPNDGSAGLRRLGPPPQIVPIAPPIADAVPSEPIEGKRETAPAASPKRRLPLPPQTPLLRSPQGKNDNRGRRSDETVARELASQLKQLRDKGQIRDFRVDLNVTDGVADLRGFVRDQRQLDLIKGIALEVDGVRRVESRLRIRQPAAAPQSARASEPRNSLTRKLDGTDNKPVALVPIKEQAIEVESRPIIQHTEKTTVLRQPSFRRPEMRRALAPLPKQLDSETLNHRENIVEAPIRLKTLVVERNVTPKGVAPLPEKLDDALTPKKRLPVRPVAATAPQELPEVPAVAIPAAKPPKSKVRMRFSDEVQPPVVKAEAISR